MNELKINVYDEKDDIVKTVSAEVVELRFGTIRKLMELLNVDDIEDTAQLLKTVYGAWSSLIKILGVVFPEMTDEDWENVKLSELIPVLVTVIKASCAEMLTIPTEKNLKAE